MLDPTPKPPASAGTRIMCPCCGIWFNPQIVEPFAEFCSEECAVTSQRFTSAGVWRRCRVCRVEYLALEPEWRLCQDCYKIRLLTG
jgi:hypothetical protein